MAEQSDEPAPTRDEPRGALVPDPVRAAGPAAARHRPLSQFVHAAGGRARGLGAPGRRGQRHRQADRRLHAARGLGRGAAAGRSLSDRHRDPHPQDVQAARRQPPADRPGARARSRSIGIIQTRPYLRAAVDRRARPELRDEDHLEIDALQRNIKSNFQQVVQLSPLLSDDLQTLAANITDPGKLADFIASSLATIGTPIKQEILETLDVRARMDALNRILIKELEVLELGSQHPVAGPVRGRQEPARVLPARADEGDPEGARRRGRAGQGDRRAARARSTPPGCPRR